MDVHGKRKNGNIKAANFDKAVPAGRRTAQSKKCKQNLSTSLQ
jgi:hypothetical protein